MAEAVAEGARGVARTEVRLRRVAELEPARQAMSSQPPYVEAQKRQAGPLWTKGELEDKPAGFFTSTATIHGGQESTILTGLVPLLHLGMIFVGTPYGQNPQIMTTDGIGGSPYRPGTLAGGDGSRQPVDAELQTARNLGQPGGRGSPSS